MDGISLQFLQFLRKNRTRGGGSNLLSTGEELSTFNFSLDGKGPKDGRDSFLVKPGPLGLQLKLNFSKAEHSFTALGSLKVFDMRRLSTSCYC